MSDGACLALIAEPSDDASGPREGVLRPFPLGLRAPLSVTRDAEREREPASVGASRSAASRRAAAPSKKTTCSSMSVVFSEVSSLRGPIPSGHSVLLTPRRVTPIRLTFVGLLKVTTSRPRMMACARRRSMSAVSGLTTTSLVSAVSPFPSRVSEVVGGAAGGGVGGAGDLPLSRDMDASLLRSRDARPRDGLRPVVLFGESDMFMLLLLLRDRLPAPPLPVGGTYAPSCSLPWIACNLLLLFPSPSVASRGDSPKESAPPLGPNEAPAPNPPGKAEVEASDAAAAALLAACSRSRRRWCRRSRRSVALSRLKRNTTGSASQTATAEVEGTDGSAEDGVDIDGAMLSSYYICVEVRSL